MFHDLIESSQNQEARKPRALVLSVFAHGVVLAVVLLIPLIYYQALPAQEIVTFLVAPPPPAAPLPAPPPAVEASPAKGAPVVQLNRETFTPPTEIPEEIPAPTEDLPFISGINLMGASGGVPGGTANGNPGGAPYGVPEGVLGGGRNAGLPPPPPPPAEFRKPIPVGGDVQNSKLVRKVDPIYPELARRARVSGIVLLQVTVDERGMVGTVRLIRGNPLLNQAAIDAVRQWRYSPTLLNGEPVTVIATVTVRFVLR